MTDTAPGAGILERPLVKVNGSALSAELAEKLVDCRVELGLARPGQAQLRFIDAEYKLMDATTFAVGAEVSVSFGDENSPKEIFKGKVASLGIDAGAGASEAVVTVTAYDGAYKIGRKSVQKVAANKKYSDIVRTIASETGLQAECPAMSITYPHTLQLADDAAVLDHICSATGHVWYVKAGKLVVAKPAVASAPAVTLEMRVNLMSFRADVLTADANQKVTVKAWDAKTKQPIVGMASSAAPALSTATAATTGRNKAKSEYPSERTTFIRPAASQNEAELIAQALLADAAADELFVRGEAYGDPGILVGATVEVTGVGRSLSGKYFITEVEHIFNRRGSVTRFSSGGRRPTTLVDLLRRGPAAPWHLRGPVIGIVTEVGKEAENGQVKLKLPTAGDNIESTWARVLSLGAGPERGLMMMPSINDEVLVAFEDGDLNRPVVLGGLWNGKDKPSGQVVQESGKVDEWLLKSLDGHTITIRKTDTDSKPAFEIALKDRDIRLVLSKEKVELMGKSGKSLAIKAGNTSITFTDQGDIQIKGGKIVLDAQKDVEINGTNIKITAKAGLNLKANTTAELAGAMVKVQAQAVAEINGKPVKVN